MQASLFLLRQSAMPSPPFVRLRTGVSRRILFLDESAAASSAVSLGAALAAGGATSTRVHLPIVEKNVAHLPAAREPSASASSTENASDVAPARVRTTTGSPPSAPSPA
ncbi:hypothetical protein EON67_11230, partial [archaeon]